VLRALVALGGAAFLSFAPPVAADPQPTDASATFEQWLEAQRDSLGRRCDARAAELDVNRTVIACGSAGLWVVERSADGSLVVAAVQDLGGDVVGLFTREGRIWAEVAHLEARPVLRAGGSAQSLPGTAAREGKSTAPAATAPTIPSDVAATPPADVDAPQPLREGRVTEVGIGEVVIDLGLADGLKQGDRIELARLVTATVGGQRATDRQIIAVAVVRAVAEDFSRVDLGLNERVELGASARLVDRNKTESRVAPPRAAGLWELMLRLRPFVALDGLGGGLLTQTSVAYRFESHFALATEIHPFGLASGKGADKATLVPAAAFLSAAYDHELFGVGLGLGFQTVHDTDFETESGSGTLVTQRLRLGARDGLMLDLRNDVVLFHSQFEFSGFVGSAMVPVGGRAWLLFEGGGGSAGYAYGEVGLRSLLRGNGQHGSLFLSVTLGGQAVYEFRTKACVQGDFSFICEDDQVYAGPMLGVGAEYRL
jgi:hypothetical protein